MLSGKLHGLSPVYHSARSYLNNSNSGQVPSLLGHQDQKNLNVHSYSPFSSLRSLLSSLSFPDFQSPPMYFTRITHIKIAPLPPHSQLCYPTQSSTSIPLHFSHTPHSSTFSPLNLGRRVRSQRPLVYQSLGAFRGMERETGKAMNSGRE